MARIYRFFLRNEGTGSGLGYDLLLNDENEPEICNQLVKVLRAKPADGVILMARKESEPFTEFEYEIENAHKKEVSLSFKGQSENSNELPFKLGLILCLPNRPDKLELILQKATELGVSDITLVSADYSQMKHGLRMDRLINIITEAAEQSERAKLPKVLEQGKLKDYLEERADADKIAVAMERGCGDAMEVLQEKKVILIGPEGGFSDDEKGQIKSLGHTTFSLGKQILRMETAAILSLGIAGQLT